MFTASWPWYVSGPLIGLLVPALLLAGNRLFGVSGALRHACSIVAPGRITFFQYDWKGTGVWNLVFVAGIVFGGFLSRRVLGGGDIEITEATKAMLAQLGVHSFSGLAPADVFSWSALLTLRGFVSIVGGGFLVGFGSGWAGGCTSGHMITGLAAREIPSLVAAVSFYVGGILCTYLVLPILLRG